MISKQTKVRVCVFAAFLQGLCLVTMPAASAIFKSPLFNQLSDHQYGMVFLPQVVASISFTLLMPLFFNRIGRGVIFYWGLLSNLFFLSLILFTLKAHGDAQQSFLILSLANFFLGMGFGCVVSVLNVAVVDLYPAHEHASLAGIHGAIGVGAGLTPLIFNYFHAQNLWYRSPQITWFLVMSLILFCFAKKVITSNNELGLIKNSSKDRHCEQQSCVAISDANLSMNETEIASSASPSRNDELIETKLFQIPPTQVLLFLFALVIYGAIEAILGNWTVSLIHGYKELSIEVASWALSCFWLFLTVGRFLVVGFADKINLKFIYRVIPFVMSGALLWIVMLKKEATVIPAFVLVGLGCAGYLPLSLSLAIKQNPKWKEILSTVGLAALMLGVGCGSFLTGFFQSLGWIHLERGFMIAALGAMILVFMNFVVTKES